jgi:hypothetical protein
MIAMLAASITASSVAAPGATSASNRAAGAAGDHRVRIEDVLIDGRPVNHAPAAI